ncbi:hypothetical protein K438DRAFT_1749825 [Mycena galopus ATCC 62051]|nr:hypothetical protein K438DRAFT_1749825 [Mycena galopus ATCC 62051]
MHLQVNNVYASLRLIFLLEIPWLHVTQLDAEEKAHRESSPPRNITHIEKRDTEILYLANCLFTVLCCTPEKDWSEMIYYANGADSDSPQSVQQPLSGPVSGYTTWEGNQKSRTFSRRHI